MTRIGVIGTGAIARVHLDAWLRVPVDLVGYFDIDRSAAEAAAAIYGGKVYDRLEDLLADVDMVDICTPGTAHKGPVLASAAAGKAIICEKPLACTLADAQAMVDACEEAGVPLYVAHVVRFFPEFALAKKQLDNGALGQPAVMRTVRAGSFPATGQLLLKRLLRRFRTQRRRHSRRGHPRHRLPSLVLRRNQTGLHPRHDLY